MMACIPLDEYEKFSTRVFTMTLSKKKLACKILMILQAKRKMAIKALRLLFLHSNVSDDCETTAGFRILASDICCCYAKFFEHQVKSIRIGRTDC
jgi:hypothetical protein